MEKEFFETYRFNPKEFDSRGRNRNNGETFRDMLKSFERDFHKTHTSEYALNVYANSATMMLLAKSCDAAPFLIYGMNLTQGDSFQPIEDPNINNEVDKYSRYITVYGIDSAFMKEYDEYGYPLIDVDSDIYPLTLLTDETMANDELRLSAYTDDDGDNREYVVITSPKLEYA